MSHWKPIDTLNPDEAERWHGLHTLILGCWREHLGHDDEPTGEVSLLWAHVVYRSSGKWMLNTAGWSGIHGNASFRVGDNATHWMLVPALPSPNHTNPEAEHG